MKSIQPNVNRHYAFYNHRVLKFQPDNSDSSSEYSNVAVAGSPEKQKNNFTLPIIPRSRTCSCDSLDDILEKKLTISKPTNGKNGYRRSKK